MAAANPWGVTANVSGGTTLETPSLNDVMSEELARDLQAKENPIQFDIQSEIDFETLNLDSQFPLDDATETLNLDSQFPLDDATCKDDLLIAQMLQDQFDREADAMLQSEERHKNGTSKVTVSYSKYKMIPPHDLWDESEEEDDYLTQDDRKRDWDWYETQDKDMGEMPRCGYKQVDGKTITKHDSELSQRSNGRRIMEFPPGIDTGDGGGIEMKLSNQVYNKIRNFSIKEGKKKHKVHDKAEKSTSELAIDQATKIMLFKYVDRGILERISGIVSTGKEAVILHAEGGPGPEDTDEPMNIPHECAIKVFKTTLNEFKTRDKYIKDDYRFRDRFSKQNPRRVVHMWAEKEMHNLRKMAKHGIPVPEAILLKKHVLLMAFIGEDGTPAPKLKDALMGSADYELAYDQVINTMRKLYEECHLIHADLSEYNILWQDKQCWFIDVSQSVEPNHPNGLEFLMRDCQNISSYFNRVGVHDVKSPTELFTFITGLPLKEGPEDVGILSQIQNFIKHDQLTKNQDVQDKDVFNYCWDQAQSKSADSASRPIPGHPGKHRAANKSGKSPRSPKMSFSKSPSSWTSAKSPKSPSGKSFASMTDEELKDMKDSMLKDGNDGEEVEEEENRRKTKKETTVTFVEPN
ncbi:serine/threonine-protein kinase RIO3-like [Tigriopus californicus]|uniref:serine/threonine-protein kinase RIO3-like n=1 Tax=Tigriopus californicus TaxID=6832 RepID=UPI0027DA01EF|nr:serine/threonine-protein kinase RIO3-like [Tigriopus californicus]